MKNEEELIKKILYNQFLREQFLKYDENKELFYNNDKKEVIKKLLKQIKIEIENMDENTFDLNLILSWYDNLLKDYYMNDDPYLVFNDPLTKIINDKILAYNIDSTNYVDYVTDMQLKTIASEKYEKYLCKCLEYKNQDYIVNDEFERYVYALNTLDCYIEEDYYYIFNMILDKLYTLNSNTYKQFFSKFGFFVFKEFDLNNIKLDFQILNKETHGKHICGTYTNAEKHIILINDLYMNSINAVKNLETLFHELKHVLQKSETNLQYRIDIIKRLEDYILMGYVYKDFKDKASYYNDNYHHITVEVDANICSRLYLLRFLELYAPLTYELEKNRIEEELKKYYSAEDKNNRDTPFNSNVDLQILFSYELRNHPEIMYDNILSVEEKIVLLQVYESNCNPKTPDKYFNEKARLLELMNKIPLNEEQALDNIKRKLNFYDGILSTFKYSIEDLARNILSLENYESTNDDITSEARNYLEKMKTELEIRQQIEIGDKNGRNKK